MPFRRVTNADGERVDGYVCPLWPGHYDWDERRLEHLRQRRKGYANQIEALAVAQKELGKAGDREGAREVKELLRYWQQREKASTQVIRWFDAEDRRFVGWPAELCSFMDEEFNAYDLF